MSEAPSTPAPVLIGIIYDFPQADDGASFETALRLGIDEVAAHGRLDRPVELLSRHARGLPGGTAHHVEVTFTELIESGALVAVGPSISDNGLIVGPMADAAGIPCINYTGGERTRGPFMFHYPVGSLAEEPAVLVNHLVAQESTRTAVIYDNTPVGRGYADYFGEAAAAAGLEVIGEAAIAPLATDVVPTVRRLRTGEPDSLVYLGLGVAARALAVAVKSEGWQIRVVANSSLMFGYTRRDWREDWEGWVYVDTVSDENQERARLRGKSRSSAAGPVGVAAYDIGRLIGEGLARSNHLTRDGLRQGLERVKQLPASSGLQGTTMGFGHWDHGALKGRYLVLRRWEGGKTVQVADQ
jgi:ABC-type branched-subunit amino acid transport system substrate-binding protein